MSKIALGDKDICSSEILQEIKPLAELEERLICPRIASMSIWSAVSDQQFLVKDQVVNVPIEVTIPDNISPPAISETKVGANFFKRKNPDLTHARTVHFSVFCFLIGWETYFKFRAVTTKVPLDYSQRRLDNGHFIHSSANGHFRCVSHKSG